MESTNEFHADIPGEGNVGAYHGSEMWFACDSLARCWRPFTGKHYDLARQQSFSTFMTVYAACPSETSQPFSTGCCRARSRHSPGKENQSLPLTVPVPHKKESPTSLCAGVRPYSGHFLRSSPCGLGQPPG